MKNAGVIGSDGARGESVMRAVRIEFLQAWVVPAVLWSLLAGPALADDLRRVALVVGNAAYEHALELRNPGNDATGMAAALEALDFQVIQGRDVDRDGFFDKLDEFTEATLGADVALFFYAGHGLQVDGRNYLVPVDARLEKKLHLKREAIDLDTVLSEMRSPTNLVFLDACRNNPLADNLARSMGGSRSVGATRGLARAEDRSGTLIAYATAEGTVAEDGEGRKNSPFTAALLEHIGIRGMSIFQMVNEVARSVKDRTAGRQEPWFHFSALPNSFPLLPEAADGFEVSEVDRVMRVSELSNARRGPGTGYARMGSLRAGDEVTVTGEVEDKPWVRVEMPDGAVAYIHEGQLSGQAHARRPAPQAPGVYLTADVSAGQRILPAHLKAIGADRIPDKQVRNYAIVAGGCYVGAKAAGSRLAWSDVSTSCSQ